MTDQTPAAASLHLWRVDMWDGDHLVAVATDAADALEVLADELEGCEADDYDQPVMHPDEEPFTLSMVDGWDSPDDPGEWRAAGFTVDEETLTVTGTCRQWADHAQRSCLLSCPC